MDLASISSLLVSLPAAQSQRIQKFKIPRLFLFCSRTKSLELQNCKLTVSAFGVTEALAHHNDG
jgi:hypothetical protein